MSTQKEKKPLLVDEAEPGVPEWVVTYGDMMSLLLTFFIMLVSMSEMSDDGKVRAMMDALQERFGPTMGKIGVPGKSLQTSSNFDNPSSQGARHEGGTKKASFKSKGSAGANPTVRRINHGTRVTLGGPALFDRFKADLTDHLKNNLDTIAQVVAKKPNKLVIRGQASPEPLPPDSLFRDHWDLSFARAHIVAQYLVQKGIDRRRVLVSAAGDTEPRVLTREKDIQKYNRRVDVFLIDSYITRSKSSDSRN